MVIPTATLGFDRRVKCARRPRQGSAEPWINDGGGVLKSGATHESRVLARLARRYSRWLNLIPKRSGDRFHFDEPP